MKSRSMSVFSSILCVTCGVKSEKPTARSKVPAASQSAGMPPGSSQLLGRAPEPHVVALGGVARDLLLIREVLLAAEQDQRADRRLVVALVAKGGRHDLQAAAEREVVGAGPVRGAEGRGDLGLAAE